MLIAKIRRPQTIIGFGEVIAGLSYFLAELFSGGFGMNWPFTVWQWVSILGIGTGAGLILWGLLKEDPQKQISILEDIKANLIVMHDCERNVAINKNVTIPAENIKKLKTDIYNYVTNIEQSLFKQITDVSSKEKVLDALIKFFVGIGDVFDINNLGLKNELQNNDTYKLAKADIAVKQQQLKKKKILIQSHVRKANLLTYGLNSSIVFRNLYRTNAEFRKIIPLQFNQNLESVERVTEKFLSEMLNNLDKDWENIITIDTNEL